MPPALPVVGHDLGAAAGVTGPPPHLAEALKVAPAKRTPQQKALLTNAFRAQDAELARLAGQIAEHPMPVDRRHPGAGFDVGVINSKSFQFNH